MSFKQLCHRFQVPGLEFQKSFAFAAKERWAFSLHFWTVLIIAAISFARTWLILTVGEGEAGSDVTFCDPSLKVTDKEESKDWKMQHSHDHCPHSSAGLPATLCLSDFGRIHEESFIKLYLYCFFLSLSLPFSAASGGLNGNCTAGRSRQSPGPAEDDAGSERRSVTSERDGQPLLFSPHAYRLLPLRSVRRKQR